MSCGSNAAQALIPLALAAFFSLIFDHVIEIPCLASPTLSADRASDRRFPACFLDFVVPADSMNAFPTHLNYPGRLWGNSNPTCTTTRCRPGVLPPDRPLARRTQPAISRRRRVQERRSLCWSAQPPTTTELANTVPTAIPTVRLMRTRVKRQRPLLHRSTSMFTRLPRQDSLTTGAGMQMPNLVTPGKRRGWASEELRGREADPASAGGPPSGPSKSTPSGPPRMPP